MKKNKLLFFVLLLVNLDVWAGCTGPYPTKQDAINACNDALYAGYCIDTTGVCAAGVKGIDGQTGPSTWTNYKYNEDGTCPDGKVPNPDNFNKCEAPTCPPGQNWDATIGFCVTPPECTAGDQVEGNWSTIIVASNKCISGCEWSPSGFQGSNNGGIWTYTSTGATCAGNDPAPTPPNPDPVTPDEPVIDEPPAPYEDSDPANPGTATEEGQAEMSGQLGHISQQLQTLENNSGGAIEATNNTNTLLGQIKGQLAQQADGTATGTDLITEEDFGTCDPAVETCGAGEFEQPANDGTPFVDTEMVEWSSGLGVGDCPTAVSFAYAGQSMTYDWSNACMAATNYFKPLLIALSLITAAFIITGARI